VHADRSDLDEPKRELALPGAAARSYGFDVATGRVPAGLVETIERVKPTVLVGTTAIGGTFTERVIRAMAGATDRPVILPLSNPTSKCEALPVDVLRWTNGRALVATGSPFDAVEVDGRVHEIGQANNVFVFPGLGLGAIAAEARTITPKMFLLAAQTLATVVSEERLAAAALFPPVDALREVSRAIDSLMTALYTARRAGRPAPTPATVPERGGAA